MFELVRGIRSFVGERRFVRLMAERSSRSQGERSVGSHDQERLLRGARQSGGLSQAFAEDGVLPSCSQSLVAEFGESQRGPRET